MSGKRILAALLALMLIAPCALAAEFDAQTAHCWLTGFADTLAGMPVRNDPQQTADPARAGQMLYAYDFGTVTVQGMGAPSADNIVEIDVRTGQIADCMGKSVGMAHGETVPARAATQLYVLSTLDAGFGWSWAYVGDEGVYGVERVCYGSESGAYREYTLTYVTGADGVISAIRMRMADATQPQAQQGMQTAQEIMGRQYGEIIALPSTAAMFAYQDAQVMGAQALGVPVYELVARLGEPQQTQTLPKGAGRILIYGGAAAEIVFNVATGEEIVRSLSVSDSALIGPRGLAVGMSVQEAAALFCCEAEVSAMGGALYVGGEAAGEPPYGEAVRGGGALVYVCQSPSGERAVLEVGISGGVCSHWRLYEGDELQGAGG